jgi:hypothetical protein
MLDALDGIVSEQQIYFQNLSFEKQTDFHELVLHSLEVTNGIL